MMSRQRLGARIACLMLFVLVSSRLVGEDFSVHLDRLAAVDPTRPLPAYRLERVFTHTGGVPDRPGRTFVAILRFAECGSVVLGGSLEEGPSTRDDGTRGTTSCEGLVAVEQVKMGWLKDSPDLFVVAWPSGANLWAHRPLGSHEYAILQLQEQAVHVLLRGCYSCGAHLTNRIQEEVSAYPFFQFDPEQGLLVEHLHRYYEKASHRPHELAVLRESEEGPSLYVAVIRETVVLTYSVSGGRLVPGPCHLFYHARQNNSVGEIARFYLGPFAPERAILDANPELVARKQAASGTKRVVLDAEDEVRIPIPDEWLLASFTHGLFRDKGGQ